MSCYQFKDLTVATVIARVSRDPLSFLPLPCPPASPVARTGRSFLKVELLGGRAKISSAHGCQRVSVDSRDATSYDAMQRNATQRGDNAQNLKCIETLSKFLGVKLTSRKHNCRRASHSKTRDLNVKV